MYRQVALKTLTYKGKLEYLLQKEIHLDLNVSKLLGCWIINLEYETVRNNDDIHLKGTYSIQLWYASNNDQKSAVYEEKINFDEKFVLTHRKLQTINDEMFMKVFVSKYPTCINMKLENNQIFISIGGLFYLDVFQEAMLLVMCKENGKDDLSLEEELLMNVNTNYLTNKK